MADNWNRNDRPSGGDCRKLVTLELDGMIWVGIRAYDGTRWLNNAAIEKARVLAWQDIPAPAYNDGLMSPMPAPTFSGEHDG